MSDNNEGKCCDAILYMLERRLGHQRSDVLVDTPERRDVDIRCKIGDQKYALEHTLIEPYGRKIHDDRVLDEVLKPVVAKLQNRSDLEVGADYNLWIDAAALTGFGGKRTSLGEWISRWASTEIKHLPLPALGQITYKDATYPGSDIGLRLARGNTGRSGSATVKYGRLVPYDLEERREVRLRKACKDKLPKLKVCKDGGARTVLVLENSDGAITNYGYVREALAKCLGKLDRELEPEPDEVYQIDTDMPNRWVIYPLRHDGRNWDLSSMDDDEAFPTFDSNSLVDLMALKPIKP